MLTLDPNWVYGGPTDPRTLPEVIDRANTHGRLTYIPIQARPEYYNYKNGLRIPFDKIPSSPVVGSYLPSEPTSPVVNHPTINDYRNMRATSPQMARTAPVNPRTYPVIETPKTYPVATVSPKSYPVIESSRYLPTSALSKFNWLKLGSKALGPLATGAAVYDGAYSLGKLADKSFGVGDYWLGNAGKGDLSELTRSAEVLKTPGEGNTYKGEISDAEFDSMSHQEKLNWLADRNQYRREAAAAAAYVPASPTATNEYGEGKAPNGNIVLGSETPADAMLPDGTMVHDGVTVAPTVDNLIATANKPRVANGVANRTQVATPAPAPAPAPTFNYGGSAPTYASSYNLNRDPNYQYSEAYAWRNNPTPAPTPWNNGWAKPNPRASSITNYYAGIGY